MISEDKQHALKVMKLEEESSIKEGKLEQVRKDKE